MRTGMATWLRAETLMMLGKLHRRRKKHEESLQCYREVTQLRPQYATAFVKLGLRWTRPRYARCARISSASSKRGAAFDGELERVLAMRE